MSQDEAIRSLRKQADLLSESLARLEGDRPVPTFGEFACSYLAKKLQRPFRASTKASFENAVRNHLLPGFGGVFIDRVTNSLWLDWVESERSQARRRKRSFFNARKVLTEIMRAAETAGHITAAPKFDNPDERKEVGRALEVSEVLKIIWLAHRPYRVIFYTFWRMGCRQREILQWEWTMIRWLEGGPVIDIPARLSKRKRSRTIPLDAGVAKLLKIRLRRGITSPFCFPKRYDLSKPLWTYESAFRTACRRAGVANAVPYDFRRTLITRCAAENIPLTDVAAALDTSVEMIVNIYNKVKVELLKRVFR